MRALILAAVLAADPTPLERAQAACEKNLDACKERDRLEAEARAADDARLEREYQEQKARDAAAEKQADSDRAVEDAKDEALKKKCGKDYHRLKVGMSWSRARECTGMEWTTKAQDQRGTTYEAQGGYVRVEGGKVIRWVAPSN
jgi:hypothetical protein